MSRAAPALTRKSFSGKRCAMKKTGALTPVRAVLLALAAVLIVLGILNGSAFDVLCKAVTVCTECIGLG